MESKKSEPLLTYNDEHIPQLTRGQKLYHYTSATGLKGICEGEFWITERAFLNDVKEFQVATQLFCEIVDKHIKVNGARPREQRINKFLNLYKIQGLRQVFSEGDCGGGRRHWQSDEGDEVGALYRKNNHDR